MTEYIDKDEWKAVDGVNYLDDSEEIKVIKSCENILVSAGPGSGKTELLAQKATFLLQTNLCKSPRKILALSFKVDAAENIKERVSQRCGNELSTRFVSKTYDSFFKEIVDRFGYLLPEEYKIAESYGIANIKDIDSCLERV